MSRYNYFDDEPEEGEKSKSIKLPQIDFVRFARKAKDVALDVVHGDAIEEIKSLSRLKRAMLKLSAFLFFVIVVALCVIIFIHTINSQNEKNNQFNQDAGTVCSDYINEYGAVKFESLDSETYGDDKARLTGLCYARQMDFDNDGSEELMLCYYDKNVYYLEVWGYKNKEFTKLYSQEANHTNDDTDGSWVGFYHKNKKYYICKSDADTPEQVELYALKGDEFKKNSECTYDYENEIYYVDEKIDASDFENIRLSCLSQTKAEEVVETVTDNIDTFGNVSTVQLETSKSKEELKADAYYEIIENRNEKYGKASVENEDSSYYIDGLAYVGLIDFNGDDNDELVLVYRRNIKVSSTNVYTGDFILVEEPIYYMEVYSWSGTVATKIFSKNGISTFMDDDSVNYFIYKNNEKTVNICSNTYSYENTYEYTAYSKIYKLSDNAFTTTFSARMEYEYGYRRYYIDDEYTYSSIFEKNGYKVPYYLNDDDTYDEDKFDVIFVSGQSESELEAVVSETVKTIQSLNDDYTP
ncbi:MAG: hypothetical protein LIO62_00640 [Clostridiales bacterium]|nr:hypothetical protein [Clostridiales bacterium]